MSKKSDLPLLNFDIPEHKRMFVTMAKGLTGIKRISIENVRPTKTLSQLAYIWGVVYPTLAPALSELWGKAFDAPRVHAVMKREYLSRPIVNEKTGEVITYEIVGLSQLDVDECSTYIESLIEFGLDMGVVVPPPSHYEVSVPA